MISSSEVEVGITTFSFPVTKLTYPSITICKENGLYDVGEYIRPVFNQFKYLCSFGDDSCQETALLREHYQNFVGNASINQFGIHELIIHIQDTF